MLFLLFWLQRKWKILNSFEIGKTSEFLMKGRGSFGFFDPMIEEKAIDPRLELIKPIPKGIFRNSTKRINTQNHPPMKRIKIFEEEPTSWGMSGFKVGKKEDKEGFLEKEEVFVKREEEVALEFPKRPSFFESYFHKNMISVYKSS